MLSKNFPYRVLYLIALFVTSANLAHAQTSAFTYQGKLTDTGNLANGQYDFQFKLFDTSVVGTGNQFGPTVTLGSVTVTSGGFVVQLDFGAGAFPGADRFLEVGVKTQSASTFTVLGPRQPVTVNPYAIRSLNSTTADGLSVACTNCITSSQIASVNGSAVTGTIPVASIPAGSANYIQNTGSQQATSNFNISGNGTAAGTMSGNVVNAATQYNLGNSRVLSNGGSFNLFAGVNAGNTNTGSSNAFFGFGAGQNNTSGQLNAFFGMSAGQSNTTASFNSYFGQGAGQLNTTGHDNAFFGTSAGFGNSASFNAFFGSGAGQDNTTGQQNSYFGYRAGFGGSTASDNSFFGFNAGANNSAGINSFFGSGAGEHNTSGSQNSFFGYHAGNATTIGNANSFFGTYAGMTNTDGANNSFFGTAAGQNNTNGGVNSFFGVLAGSANTTGGGNSFFGENAGVSNTTGEHNSFFGREAGLSNTTGDFNTTLGAFADVGSNNLNHATAIGAGAIVSSSNTIVLGRSDGSDVVDVPGKLQIDTLGTAGSTNLCLNSSNRVAPCSSSLRYKTNFQPFADGLSIINRLQPISFTWKDGGMRDIGLGAEDVAKVEPLLTFRNAKGEIEGVKYNQLSVVFINAIKQQQEQIQQQQVQLKAHERQAAIQQEQIGRYRNQLTDEQRQIQRQQAELNNLKSIVCLDHPKVIACKARRHTK